MSAKISSLKCALLKYFPAFAEKIFFLICNRKTMKTGRLGQ